MSAFSCSVCFMSSTLVIIAAAPPQATGVTALFKRFGSFDKVQCERELNHQKNATLLPSLLGVKTTIEPPFYGTVGPHSHLL